MVAEAVGVIPDTRGNSHYRNTKENVLRPAAGDERMNPNVQVLLPVPGLQQLGQGHSALDGAVLV